MSNNIFNAFTILYEKIFLKINFLKNLLIEIKSINLI